MLILQKFFRFSKNKILKFSEMLGRMSVFCPLTSDHSHAMPATKYLSKPKKFYPKPWFSLPKHGFPCQNFPTVNPNSRHPYRGADRPPWGAWGLLGKHIWDDHEGFRPGIYLVNILWKSDEKKRVPRFGSLLDELLEAPDLFSDPLSKDRMVSAFEAGADAIR